LLEEDARGRPTTCWSASIRMGMSQIPRPSTTNSSLIVLLRCARKKLSCTRLLSACIYQREVAAGIWVDLQLSSSGPVITKKKPPRRVHNKMEPQPPDVITVPTAEIAGIRVGYNQEPYKLPVTLQFAQRTKFGNHISFNAAPNVALTLVHWQQQVQGKRTKAP
jgi:hypothetical protein